MAEILETLGRALGAARVRERLASALAMTGKYEEAQAVGDEGALLAIGVRWASALWVTGRLDEAEHVLAERMLPLAEKCGDIGVQWSAVNGLAMFYGARGDYEEERVTLQRTVALAERMGEDAYLALAFAHLGDNAFATGAWGKAREQYERADALMRRIDSWMWSAVPATALGLLAIAQGDWDAGNRCIEQVRGQGERGKEMIFWLDGVLAERDLLAGRASEALGRLKGLLEEPHRSNTSFHELRALLGCALARAEDMARGVALANEVVEQARAQGMRSALVDALRYRAWIAIEQGQPEVAASALDESLALAGQMPRPYSEAKSHFIYGLLHLARGEHEAVRERFRAALAICERLGERLYAEHIEGALGSLAD